MISFIVPAHNEEYLIGGTLGALHVAAAAMNEPYEIVVVDDASTDGTSTVAAGCGARVLPVHHGRSAQRGTQVRRKPKGICSCSSMPIHTSPERLSSRL